LDIFLTAAPLAAMSSMSSSESMTMMSSLAVDGGNQSSAASSTTPPAANRQAAPTVVDLIFASYVPETLVPSPIAPVTSSSLTSHGSPSATTKAIDLSFIGANFLF
jgi:hypothetical protein